MKPATHTEVLGCLNELKNSGSIDTFGISSKILKKVGHIICEVLTHLINASIEQGIFPQNFKTAIVTPVHKKGSKTDPNNYRPISIIPIIAKILEKIVLTRLTKFFENNNLLSTV